MKTKICPMCGSEFEPKNSTQKYCREIKTASCKICGRPIEYICGQYVPNSCDSESCIVAYQKQAFMEKHGVENAMQLPDAVEKIRQSNLKKYGVDWYVQTNEYKERVKHTSLEKYGVEHHLQSKEVISKRIETVRDKYGSDNVFSSEYGKAKVKETLMERYGVINPSQNPESKTKATRNARYSKLEEHVKEILDNYSIEYIYHYVIRKDDLSHEFDFYIPKYNLLIDADGLYYHAYLDDPDGGRVREDYDEVRLKLVPEGFIFQVVVETNEEKQIKELMSTLVSIDGDLLKYDSKLFEWCRSIPFPYPSYTDKRLFSDWNHLQNYFNDTYIPQCRIGLSLIKQFHRSIYECHVGTNLSPLEGWYDDDKLKQVIKNRLIYRNNVDPSKILAGFSVSKTCPSVSIFNPILARYLTLKYLNCFDTVFDPFSGFSGRLLGVTSCGKHYVGQDINARTINECSDIISLLNLSSVAKVSRKDILSSSGNYQCLLTCPPYNKKEIYGSETVFKSCDEWIDECLNRFDCERYVFVIDKTEKYSKYITETISSDSHFNKTLEYVVVIDSDR